MRRHVFNYQTTYLLVLTVGIGTLLVGLLLLFGQAATLALAQDAEETPAATAAAENIAAEYVGARECRSCHRGDLADAHEVSPHALALQEVSEEDPSVILADFAGDVPEIQFPGEDTARKLTPADIVYVIGAGRKVQRYLYQNGDQYVVLPYEWNVAAKAWKPYLSGHPWPDDAAYDWQTNCAGCHTTGLDIQSGEWVDSGVQCEACHGPGSAHIEAADAAGRRPSEEEVLAIRNAIFVAPDAQMCGQCHSAGVATEGNFPYPVGYRPRTDLLASFNLAAPDDSAHWWPTGHAQLINMQFNEWSNSGHASALSVLKESDYPADESCLTCHSADYAFAQRQIALYEEGEFDDPAPEPATLETAQYGVTCLSCHAPHAVNEDGERVSFQTGNSDIYGLCTQCHSNTNVDFVHHPAQEMFEGVAVVPNVEALPSSHFTEENGPRCATCHMPGVSTTDAIPVRSHSLQPILPGPAANVAGLQDSCLGCHKNQVDALQMQQMIDDIQADTQARLDAVQAALPESAPDWVKTALAFVAGDGSLGIHNYAYTDALLDAVEGEISLDQPDTGNPPAAGS